MNPLKRKKTVSLAKEIYNREYAKEQLKLAKKQAKIAARKHAKMETSPHKLERIFKSGLREAGSHVTLFGTPLTHSKRKRRNRSWF